MFWFGNSQRGFSTIERTVFFVIIIVVILVTALQVFRVREVAYTIYTNNMFDVFGAALEKYREANLDYPPDTRGAIPSEMEPHLAMQRFESGVWQSSYYEWENWTTENGQQVIQLSLRFCPQGTNDETCSFPRTTWARDFTPRSAYFYCFAGPCRAHRDEARNYPGFCANCDCQDMAQCYRE